MHAKRKEKEEEPPICIVSCEPQVFSTHGQKNPHVPHYQEQFEMPTTLKHLNKLK
jgi:hypothetical protein